MITLVCHALVGVVAATIDLWYASLVDRLIVDLDSVSEAEIETGDLVYGLSGVLEVLAYAITAVAFLVWLYRVRTNAEVLSPDGHRRSRPWVIFGWIVPIICFWFPKQIVDDIWYASARTPRPSKALPNAWWAIWISVTLATQVASRLLLRADDLESMAAAARFDVVSIAFMIIAALLATGVISRITHAQEEHRSAAAAGLPPFGTPPPGALGRTPFGGTPGHTPFGDTTPGTYGGRPPGGTPPGGYPNY
ncbi:DUF4328 domain-containing protein [Nonomuraea maritima]|nr:DUF4328 domain-containing protein [Nonomuraea maritima]